MKANLKEQRNWAGMTVEVGGCETARGDGEKNARKKQSGG